MISAISNRSKVHFMFCKDTMRGQKLIEFMECIISCNERNVFLILDNLRIHRSKLSDDFLHEHAAFIKVFHLPVYCPDLNPDEYLNRYLKSTLNNKLQGRAKGKIEEHAKAYMNDVSRNPGHIARLFHAESVLYASRVYCRCNNSLLNSIINKEIFSRPQKEKRCFFTICAMEEKTRSFFRKTKIKITRNYRLNKKDSFSLF